MNIYITAYFTSLIAFLILDGIWLGLVAKSFYSQQLGSLMAENIKFGIAAGFYTLYVVGVIIFAVKPALDAGSLSKAIILGALFGFFCYATYDFTNMATLKDWPIKMSIVDIIWGAFVTAATAGIGTLAARYTTH